MTDSTTTMLLEALLDQMGDLREQVGGINQQLNAGAETHKRFEQTLQMLDRRTDITEDKVVAIDAALNPDDGPSLLQRVTDLEVFKGKIGASVLVAGTIVGGALSLIYAGVWWVLNHITDIKNAIRTFFH